MINRENDDCRSSIKRSTAYDLPILHTIAPGEKLSNDWTHLSPAVIAAYEVCLEVEKELICQQTPILITTETKALNKRLVNILILGYLLIHGPTNTACDHVAKTILAGKDGGSDAVTNWGAFYDQLLLRICKFSPHFRDQLPGTF